MKPKIVRLEASPLMTNPVRHIVWIAIIVNIVRSVQGEKIRMAPTDLEYISQQYSHYNLSN